MAGDDDLKASLPDPPPPASARRDAAIEEAMRRFEGKPPSTKPASKPRNEGWGAWIWRPQVGGLATIGLMVLIGVPAAWMTANHEKEMASQKSTLPTSKVAPMASSVPGNQAVASIGPKAFKASSVPTSGSTSPPIIGEEPRAEASAKPNLIASPSVVAAPVVSTPAAPIETASDDYRAEFRSAPSATAPLPPPPAISTPAPIAPVQMAADRAHMAARDVVVTGSHVPARRPGRGDWNACTVDDPSRSLSLCDHLIDISAPSPAGVAAAHVTDGLLRAWHGDMGGAIQAFDAAIAVAPRLPQAYLNRSLAYAHNGDERRALDDANKAVRYAPGAGSAQAYYNRSILLRRQGKIDKAKADEIRAIEIDPTYEAAISP